LLIKTATRGLVAVFLHINVFSGGIMRSVYQLNPHDKTCFSMCHMIIFLHFTACWIVVNKQHKWKYNSYQRCRAGRHSCFCIVHEFFRPSVMFLTFYDISDA